MLPIDEFLEMLHLRTKNNVTRAKELVEANRIYLQLMMFLFVVFNVFIYLLLNQRVICPINSITSLIVKHKEESDPLVFEHRFDDEIKIMVKQFELMNLELEGAKNSAEQAEERSRLILESAGEGIFGVGKDGLVNFINPAALDMLGFTEKEVIGQEIHALIHHTRPDGTPYPVEECPMHHSLTRGTTGNQDDEILWRKDGTFFHAEYTSVPIHKDDSILGTVVIFRDITEGRIAQEQARKLSRATEDSPAMVMITTKDGIIEYVNSTFCKVSGYSKEEAIGNNPKILKSGNLSESFYKNMWETILSGKTWRGDFINLKKSGEEYWESASISPIKNSKGEITHFVAVKQDITERKHMEKELIKAKQAAEQANRAKSAFLANMSHELRTPMNAIIGYSEMLQDELGDLGQTEFLPDLEKIHSAGKHLLSLINDILDLSKIEAGKMDLYLERFDVKLMLDEVVSTVEQLVKKNGNTLDLKVSEFPGMIRSDMTKLRQVLFNLLSNAAKFTKDGTVSLTAKEVKKSGCDWIELAIKDDGIGIAADKISDLFDEFTQADGSTTRNYGGTGLGLAISRRFCQMMGGDIAVDSELGKGTTFTVWMPVEVKALEVASAVISETKVRGEDDSEMPPSPDTTSRHILVIDDDIVSCEMLKRILEKESYRVTVATSADEGLKLARELRPDAITLDVVMPGADGWTLLTKLKSDAELMDIPVIMLSIQDDKAMGFSLGAAEYMTKPVDRIVLLKLLKKHIQNRDDPPILVVDDSAEDRRMLCRFIEKEGWSFTEAGNGRDALEAVSNKMPTAIILDLMMPIMDGFEFVEAFRKLEHSQDVPIIVVTALDLNPDERMQLNQHVGTVMQKASFSSDQFLSDLRKVLINRDA